jgi:hypothetical protein
MITETLLPELVLAETHDNRFKEGHLRFEGPLIEAGFEPADYNYRQ